MVAGVYFSLDLLHKRIWILTWPWSRLDCLSNPSNACRLNDCLYMAFASTCFLFWRFIYLFPRVLIMTDYIYWEVGFGFVVICFQLDRIGGRIESIYRMLKFGKDAE